MGDAAILIEPMGFRDENEALRFQLSTVERELIERRREREEQSAALATLEAEIEREVRIVSGKGRVFLLMPLLVALAAVVFTATCGSGGSDAEMMFADVDAVTGQPPVPVGARCTLFVTPITDDDASFDTDVEILCNGTLVYGGGSLGGVNCDKVDDRAVRCEDTDFTKDGGDPKMLIDRRAGRVVVEDRAPDYRLELRFAPPPRSL